jgi:hypothetical protein
LRGLFFLAHDVSEVAVERPSPGETVMALLKFAYNLDVHDDEFLRKQLDTLVRLTEDVPMHTICYPRDFAALPAVRKAILRNLQEDLKRDPE